MKKLTLIMSILKIPLVIILAIALQIIIANNFEIFGVTPNIILVTIVIISLWNKTEVNILVAVVMGILSDMIFSFDFGKSLVAYLIIALCVSLINNKYRKESKAAIIYITVIATCIFSGFEYLYYMIDNSLIINIFTIIKQTIVGILLNIALSYVVYKVFEKSMKKEELTNFYR